jgi:thymidylate synthase (FAD)
MAAINSKILFISDGVGSVELLETFGDDLTVVNAARVSFAKESTEMSVADEKLINYLAKNDHITPFFHPQIRFRIKMPIFVAREWFRHQIGLSRNEVSRRYVDFEPECWSPADGLRARDPKLKQGSKDTLIEDNTLWTERIAAYTKDTINFYKELLAAQVAPELARTVLPQSMYTEFIETGSLSAYARICGLRLDPHAQKEIREYAALVSTLMERAFPVSWKALTNRWTPAPAPAPPAAKPLLSTTTENEIVSTTDSVNRTITIEGESLKVTIPQAPPVEAVTTIDPVTLKKKENDVPCYTQWGC